MRVIVAMSGGVDSSVAAALLKEQGHEVEGIFMKNWSPETIQSMTDCPWEQDQADAEAVCRHLGIPFRSINFEKEYKQRVVDYFLGEYNAGRTPNPDIMCNKEIKFAAFLDAARDIGCDYMATGHYARVEHGEVPSLYRGVDVKKDQSYFLHTLNAEQLGSALFPLGALEKTEVRALAERFKLPTANKKDSQGICFIGHIDLKEFLQEQLGVQEGSVYLLPDYVDGDTIEDRKARALLVGKHRGSKFYTRGERARSCIDNRLYRILTGNVDVEPCYVASIEPDKNALFVTRQHDDAHLYATAVYLERFMYTGTNGNRGEVSTLEVLAKEGKLGCQVRYQQKPVAVLGVGSEGEKLRVATEPLWAVMPGQSLVLYVGDKVIGGGVVCTMN